MALHACFGFLTHMLFMTRMFFMLSETILAQIYDLVLSWFGNERIVNEPEFVAVKGVKSFVWDPKTGY